MIHKLQWLHCEFGVEHGGWEFSHSHGAGIWATIQYQESESESKYFIDTSYPHGIEHQRIQHTYKGVTLSTSDICTPPVIQLTLHNENAFETTQLTRYWKTTYYNTNLSRLCFINITETSTLIKMIWLPKYALIDISTWPGAVGLELCIIGIRAVIMYT